MPASTSRSGADYLFIASGLPIHITWQTFKDELRSTVRGQPGWADVMKSQTFAGTIDGWCRFEKWEDALRAYNHYSKQKHTAVHIFQTSRGGQASYQWLQCNCSSIFPGVPARSHTPNRSGLDSTVITQTLIRFQNGTVHQQMASAPTDGAYPYGGYAQVQAYPYQQIATYTPQPVQYATPMYSASMNGMSVNVSNGGVLTEARGVFISRLSFACGEAELYNLIAPCKRKVLSAKIMRESNGRSKGVALVKFESAQEAQQAVKYLNNQEHMGMRIKARLDVDTTTVGQVQAPVIANGSRV